MLVYGALLRLTPITNCIYLHNESSLSTYCYLPCTYKLYSTYNLLNIHIELTIIAYCTKQNGSKDVCSYKVFVHTNPAINESVMPTTEDMNSLIFTMRPLDRDKVYDVVIEAKISLRNVKSSVQLKISKFLAILYCTA